VLCERERAITLSEGYNVQPEIINPGEIQSPRFVVEVSASSSRHTRIFPGWEYKIQLVDATYIDHFIAWEPHSKGYINPARFTGPCLMISRNMDCFFKT
jgi:hypothetical protein